jgi:hypothetical protein
VQYSLIAAKIVARFGIGCVFVVRFCVLIYSINQLFGFSLAAIIRSVRLPTVCKLAALVEN